LRLALHLTGAANYQTLNTLEAESRLASSPHLAYFAKEHSHMADQDLKNKYQPVADFMSRNGFQIQHFHVENNKAVLTASAPTEFLKNRAWDEIKKADPNFSDLQHNITVGPETMYVVKSGDNLSNISKSFYGSPNEYTKIVQANNISNPDKIQPGQKIKIPAA
jgi:nucleoid-associated protein YgaU